MADDIFQRKRKEPKPQVTGSETYLSDKKNVLTSKQFQDKFLKPTSALNKGQNVRLHKETHALLKAISLQENRELYSIIQKSLNLYLDQLTKEEQKKVWEKLSQLIELNIVKV